MLPLRVSTCLLIGVAMALAVVAGHADDPQPQPPQKQPPKQPKKQPKKQPAQQSVNEVIQEFPSNGEMETAWKVQWATQSGYGLCIQNAWFKRGPTDRWIQILGDARISEIFVP